MAVIKLLCIDNKLVKHTDFLRHLFGYHPLNQESVITMLEKGKATQSTILAWRIPWTV